MRRGAVAIDIDGKSKSCNSQMQFVSASDTIRPSITIRNEWHDKESVEPTA